MIRFMVCDTDVDFAYRIAKALHHWYEFCSVQYLYGPSALEASLQSDSGGADVLITEIELRGKNAIDIVAENLQNSSPLQVVYMTEKMDFCTDVYRTRHSGFLVKPIRLEKLKMSMEWALQTLKTRKSEGVMLQRAGNMYVVSPQSILFAESSGRLMTVVTDTEKIEIYGKISDLAAKVDQRFIQCHKSYLVNMERVKQYCGDFFLMENGSMVPVSQSRRKVIRESFLTYVQASVVDRVH